MNINLEIVTLEEKEKLKKLLQLYLQDRKSTRLNSSHRT